MAIVRWQDMAKVNYPLTVLAENYIVQLTGSGRSPHTIKGFGLVLRAFQDFLTAQGEQGGMDELCPEAVVAYRAHLITAKKYKLSSVRFHIQVLKAWAAYLTEEGVFRSNPLARRGLLPKIPKPLPKCVSDGDRAKIVDLLSRPGAGNARDMAIFCLFLDTGLRVSELAAIKLADVDFRRNEVRVWGKGAKERRVGFGKRTARYLQHYVSFDRRRVADEDASDGHLFLCHGGHSLDGREKSGEPLSAHGVKQLFQRLAQKLGIKLHPHQLRHTFTTEFLNNGGSVADLQRILGHESPQMSLYYAHITNRDAVERQKTNSVVDRQLKRVT